MSKMQTVWRVVRGIHGETQEAAFSGEGSRIFGGRWNAIGTPVVYCAATRSLGLLELLVNTKEKHYLKDISVYSVEMPTALIETVSMEDLPPGWDAFYKPISSQKYGEQWLLKSKVPVLEVPSVLIPEEFNYMLNPLHPKFADLQFSKKLPLPIDPRLLR